MRHAGFLSLTLLLTLWCAASRGADDSHISLLPDEVTLDGLQSVQRLILERVEQGNFVGPATR